jgi:hypothetical protein
LSGAYNCIIYSVCDSTQFESQNSFCLFWSTLATINPNPNCFIAITKATACGWKEPLLPHPLHSTAQPCERGEGVLALCSWWKRELHLNYHTENDIFNENLWN